MTNLCLPLVFLLICFQLFLHVLSFLVFVVFLLCCLQIHGVLLLESIRVASGVSLDTGSTLDVGGIEEPNVSVLILQEFCLHLKDLILIHFLDVVRKFVALLDSKVFIVLLCARLKEVNIV